MCKPAPAIYISFNTMQPPSAHEPSLQLPPLQPLAQIYCSAIIYCSEYYPNPTPWLHSLTTRLLAHRPETVLESVEVLMGDLARELVHGPSGDYVVVADRPHCEYINNGFVYEQGEERVDVSEIGEVSDWVGDVEQLLWYRRGVHMRLSGFIHKKVTAQTTKQLEVNGEFWNKCLPLPTLLLTLQKLLAHIIASVSADQLPLKYHLLQGRLAFLHNKLLHNPAQELAARALSSYRTYLNLLRQSKQLDLLTYIESMLQYANVLLFYYKYKQCENIVEFCKELGNVEMQFTGKLGRRTKYQSFDTAQLVMNIGEKTEENKQLVGEDDYDEVDKDAIPIPDAKQLVLAELTQQQSLNPGSLIPVSSFDEDNILLQKPLYCEPQSEQQPTVTLHKLLVTLFSTQHLYETTPKQQMLYQQVSTSIQTIMEHQSIFTYPIMFNVLLLRSVNEFPRMKNTERALDQLQKLRAYYNEKTQKDCRFLYCSSYVSFLEFIKILAQKYMDIGLTMTAIELYEKLGMLEQCIDGLITKSYKQKALALAHRFQKEHGNTSRLLCMLGDLEEGQKSEQLYKQAWELSGQRNARAQRSLGWYYFKNKDLVKAAEAFKKATEANFYHPNTWFTLGCCYMQLKQFNKAIPAFGECVCIDETQGEAWGNIASCYLYQNKLKQAYSTLEQALKHAERNWKLWANMLSVSLKLKKFYKYFECITRLVHQQKSQAINPEVLAKVVKIFQYQQETSQRRRPIQAMKNRLDRLYQHLVSKIGQNPMVWHSIHEYNLQLQNFVTQNYTHYKKLHESNLIDINDVLEGYSSMEQLNATVSQDLRAVRENILSSKQTELNMTMKIGWDSNKMISEEVLKVLQEYMDVFVKYGEHKIETVLNQFKVFVNGVRQKLEHCLERQIQLKCTLL